MGTNRNDPIRYFNSRYKYCRYVHSVKVSWKKIGGERATRGTRCAPIDKHRSKLHVGIELFPS